MTERLRNIKQFYFTHERHITTSAFLFGFIIDSLTLRRIDLLYENIVLMSYLVVAALSIVVIAVAYRKEAISRRRSFFQYTAPLALQFAFGGLFSGFFIFYTRSALLVASWPFLLVLLALLIGNEFLKRHYTRITFQISIFFFLLFSFLIFYVPIVVNELGTWVFLLSGAVSLVLIFALVKLLGLFVPEQVQRTKYVVTGSVLSIFALVNVLYFTNIIPPIPLSLKDAGVYHTIERVNSQYRVEYEPEPWYAFLELRDEIHKKQNAPVYVFSSVFAPTDLDIEIVHEWQFYDEVKESWTTTDVLPFQISGGRDEGYRGYTRKSNIVTGTWRVNIKTKQGQLIGREVFDVYEVQETETKERLL